MKNIYDYFDECVTYPQNQVHNMLPYNELWEYTSYTLLNYVITQTTPIKVFVVDRYRGHNEELSTHLKDAPTITKIELIKKVQNDKELAYYISNLDIFKDDIIVLSTIEASYNEWEDEYKDYNHFCFFWFDRDVSDCVIGKFRTEDTEEQVIESLYEMLKNAAPNFKPNDVFDPEPNIDGGVCGYHELPVEFAKNYASF